MAFVDKNSCFLAPDILILTKGKDVGVSRGISYHCAHCPCIHTEQPQLLIVYQRLQCAHIHFRMSSTSGFPPMPCRLSQISNIISSALAYPGAGRYVVRYHPIYAPQCYFILFYTLPHLKTDRCFHSCHSSPVSTPYSYQPCHPCQYRSRWRPHWLACS